ncbi:MAG: heterodisulfide reductase-related iron-sulfur binding cluster, partial [Rhodospirillales bacterium]|nr:heterodisulfide reductase-related iron-sulfur binding cluster [Rhodospirillales bacterium]
VDAWTKQMNGAGLDAIVINASGCGTTVKDYGFMLREDPDWAAKAAKVSELTKDVTEVLADLDMKPAHLHMAPKVVYHSACSMQHGQKLTTGPKSLLTAAGFDVAEPAESHLCCGSAGTYNLLQPELSKRLLERKAGHLEATGAAVVATGNIGCAVQIAEGTDMPVLHTVELLDWATGGPKPARLG